MNCLFITCKRETAGGKLIMDRNLDFCKRYFGEKNVYYLEPAKNLSRLKQLISIFTGSFYPLSNLKRQVDNLIKRSNISYVFVDLSLYGNFIKYLKVNNPEIKVLCFFHNIEYNYFKDLYKYKNNLLKKIILNSVYNSEKKSVLYSDIVIAMNSRDSNEMYLTYRRSADFELPSSLDDVFIGYQDNDDSSSEVINLLFVGSAFFANIEAVKWFVDKVVPNLKINFLLTIVGKGFENVRFENLPLNVEIQGFVKDLTVYYKNAHYVVSPIFSGSGMKTKTAEALMYGKNILGTDEAFEGFEVNYEKVGGKLNTADEYINFLNSLSYCYVDKYNAYSRNIFLEKYCSSSLYSLFSKSMNKLLYKKEV